MINDRYTILRRLGEGGTGEVYLVSDCHNDRSVAMKIFREELLQNPESIRHEFDLLKQFTHPNLIHVFEFNVIRTSPANPSFLRRFYYTMEYLDGCDALDHFVHIVDGPQKALQLEEAFIQTLLSLLAIHQKGIVHYDIKPQNIFVVTRTNGSPWSLGIKVADFGFSTNTFSSKPTVLDGDHPGTAEPQNVTSSVRGTIEYIAPELLGGKPFDQRIDLYSLGATFYHLWNGHCPFQGSTVLETVKEILSAEAPSNRKWHSTSSRLPAIIGRLLKKNPEERYQSAWEILFDFASSPHEESIKRSLHAITSLNMVGRERESRILDHEAGMLFAGQSPAQKIIIIEGPPSSGKSALVQHFARRCDVNVGTIIQFSCGEKNLQSVGKVCNQNPMMTDVFQEIASNVTSNPPGRVTAATHRNAMSSPGSTADKDGPMVCFIIDDIDRADKSERRYITDSIKSKSLEKRLLLLTTSEEDDQLSFMSLTDSAVRIRLDELTKDDIQVLFSSAVPEGLIPNTFAKAFHEMYGGNPGIVQLAMSMLINAIPLALWRNPKSFDILHAGLEELLVAGLSNELVDRSSKLCNEKQILLRLFSCIALPAPVALLVRLVPFERKRLQAFFHSLEQSGYIKKNATAENYSLRHKSLQQSLYASIDLEERRTLHEFIALCWTGLSEPLSWEEEEELGRQFKLAGRQAEAAIHYERSGDIALGVEKYAEAATLYAKACQTILSTSSVEDATDRSVLAIRIKQGRAHGLAGADAEAVALWKDLLQFPLGPEQNSEITKELGKGLIRLGENNEAMTIFEALLQNQLSAIDRFEVQEELIALKIAAGHFDSALVLGSSQRTIALQFADRQHLALVETDIGIAHFYKGELQKSLEAFRRAHQIYSEVGNAEKTATLLNNIGNVRNAMGETRQALESWNSALATAPDPAKHRDRGFILNNIGIAHFSLSEYEQARESYGKAREFFTEVQQKNGIAYTLTNMGEVEFSEGNYENAIHCWQDALQFYQELQDSLGIAQSLLAIASVYLCVGDGKTTRELLDEVATVMKEYSLSSLEPFYHILEGEHAFSLQKYDSALPEFKQAEEGYRSIPDPFTCGNQNPVQMIIQSRFRRSELWLMQNQPIHALEIIERTDADNPAYGSPLLRAERDFILSKIGHSAPIHSDEKSRLMDTPIVLLKRAFETVASEHVTELTWQISYELAKEYQRRGNRDRACELFIITSTILKHFLSKFSDETLCAIYLTSKNRAEVLRHAEEEVKRQGTKGPGKT